MLRYALILGLLAACASEGGTGDGDADTDTDTHFECDAPPECQLPGGAGTGLDCRCNGVCVDVQTNPNSCGACFLPCGVESGRSSACVDGQCRCGDGDTCSGGISDTCCPAGGARLCADLLTDEQNCGACGVACEPPASNICRQGICVCGTPAPGNDPAPCPAGQQCCGDEGDAVCLDEGSC